MTPKKVWAVIIMVVGVIFFFGGVSKCYEADSIREGIAASDKAFAPISGDKNLDSLQMQHAIDNEKNNGIIGTLLGIAMAVGGARLLKKKQTHPKIIVRTSHTAQDGTAKKDIHLNPPSFLGSEINAGRAKNVDAPFGVEDIAIAEQHLSVREQKTAKKSPLEINIPIREKPFAKVIGMSAG